MEKRGKDKVNDGKNGVVFLEASNRMISGEGKDGIGEGEGRSWG